MFFFGFSKVIAISWSACCWTVTKPQRPVIVDMAACADNHVSVWGFELEFEEIGYRVKSLEAWSKPGLTIYKTLRLVISAVGLISIDHQLMVPSEKQWTKALDTLTIRVTLNFMSHCMQVLAKLRFTLYFVSHCIQVLVKLRHIWIDKSCSDCYSVSVLLRMHLNYSTLVHPLYSSFGEGIWLFP